MFNSKKKSKIDPNSTDTLIGEGTHFEGKIQSEAGIRIEGHLTGDIVCTGDVTIGEHGKADSHISARHVILAGQVNGNVAASGKLTIKATGKLFGNLSAKELSIESGGLFQGNSKMDAAQGQPVAEEKRPSGAKDLDHIGDESATAALKTW